VARRSPPGSAPFAGYEQQVSANASLAASYGQQLGIAVTRLIDLQQAANRGAGVSTPLAGDALASSRRGYRGLW
jgi:hypothetical protein